MTDRRRVLLGWAQMGVRERLYATLVVLRGRAGRGVRPRDLRYNPSTDDLWSANRGDLAFCFPVVLEPSESSVAIRTLAPTKYPSLVDLMEEISSDD